MPRGLQRDSALTNAQRSELYDGFIATLYWLIESRDIARSEQERCMDEHRKAGVIR